MLHILKSLFSRPALIAVAFLLSLPAVAQRSFSGRVLSDSTEHILAGASLYFTDLKRGTVTNDNGEFFFKNLKPGIYTLEVSSVGYKNIIQQIRIAGDTVVNFGLSPATRELSEVIVTGVSRSTVLSRSPVIIKAIGRDELDKVNATNLVDGLKWIPGVDQISTGTTISKPVIRGLGYNRVITLNNGVKQEGQQWGDEHGIEIDENSIDRVEIIKGPGSLMYGSDGIAGVVNFLQPKALPQGQIKTYASANYQTNSGLFGYSVANAGSLNGLQWLGRFSSKTAGNYRNKYDGYVYNSGAKEINGNIFLGINKRWGHSYINASTYNSHTNLPEGERDENGKFITVNSNGEEVVVPEADLKGYHEGIPKQQINHNSIGLRNYFILNNATLAADISVQNNKRREFANPEDPNEAELFFDLTTLNYNARYNLNKVNNWETSFGISGMAQQNKNKAEERLIPDYRLFDAGAFVFTQKNFQNLTLAAGLRFDNRRLNSKALQENNLPKFVAFTKDYSGFSGSIGISYRTDTNNTFKLNLSRGFRAPNIAELASNGRHEGTFRYEIGNASLKLEINHQVDFAYLFNTDHLSFEITPFLNYISNYVFAQKLLSVNGGDSIPDLADPAPAYKFTSGKALLKGAEIYLDIHPHPLDWLHVENSFSFVHASQKDQPDSTKYLPMIPPAKYNGEIMAQLHNLHPNISGAYLSFGLSHYFKQNRFYRAYGTETATPAYTLLSAGMGATLKAFGRKDFMKISIIGENLANKAYQSHLSRLKYAPENPATGRTGIYNMGRNISFKVLFTI